MLRQPTLAATLLLLALVLGGCTGITPLRADDSPSWRLVQKPLRDQAGGFRDVTVEDMRFLPNATRLVSIIRVWNRPHSVQNVLELMETRPARIVSSVELDWTRSMQLTRTPNDSTVAFASEPTPRLVRPDLTQHPLPPDTKAISDDGRLVYLPGTSGAGMPWANARIQEVASGRAICDLGWGTNSRNIQIGRHYAVAGLGSGGAVLCELSTGRVAWLQNSVPGFGGSKAGTADSYVWLDHHGRWLVIGSDTTLALYALPLDDRQYAVTDGERADITPVLDWPWWPDCEPSDCTDAVAFSPDGRWLARGLSGVTLHRLNDLDAPPLLVSPDEDVHHSIKGALFARDRERVVMQDNRHVYVLDLAESRLAKLSPPEPIERFTLHDLSADGTQLLVAVQPIGAESETQRLIWAIEPLTP